MGQLRESGSKNEQAESPQPKNLYLTGVTAADGPRIVSTPGICGGSARIRGTRLPIWGLEVGRRVGRSDENLLRAYPALTAADLEAAWRYVGAHIAEIEAEITENDGA